MPGNGNSQMNYQQRKSLKKTSSNEQYKVTNQQYKNASRGGSMNSSQNEPTKYQNMANNSEQENQFKIMKMRPTSNTNSHGGGVIQQSVSGHG